MKLKTILAGLTLGSALCTSSYGTVITGTDTYSINGNDSFVDTFDHATLNLNSGSEVAFVFAHDASHVNLYDGELSWLYMYDQSTAALFKTGISWLLLEAGSSAAIYGSNFSYAGGHLNGNWIDGTPFSFWALNIDSTGQFNDPNLGSMPQNISLHNVPVPGTLYLLGPALFPLLGFYSRRVGERVHAQ